MDNRSQRPQILSKVANSQLTAGAPPRQEKCDEIRPGSGGPAAGSISCHFAGGGAEEEEKEEEKEEKEEEKEKERCGAPEAQVEVGTCQKHHCPLIRATLSYSRSTTVLLLTVNFYSSLYAIPSPPSLAPYFLRHAL